MFYLFTRRAYFAAKSNFTNRPAGLTRYLRLSASGDGIHSGHAINRDNWLSEALASARTPDILIFVHGYNTSQSSLLLRHAMLQQKLAQNGFKGTIVSFDWPSDGSNLSYLADRNEAKAVANALLTDGILMFLAQAPKHRVHILAHSMGTYLTLRALSAGGRWAVEQVIFTAADVDSDWMKSGAWGSLVMQHRCKQFTNFHNTRDEVLILSKNMFNRGAARAGLDGLPGQIPKSYRDVYCTEQYKTRVAAPTMIRSHNWYFEDVGFYRDLALTLAGTAADQMPTRVATNTGGQALYA
ncbi:alpha/beta fold hydrolase [Paracoccus sp. 11-3]|uniref:Alpha/beta fold hydrolase n=1 Tax=Paracoccus amoyensis TaxID=2760093 RepID=A0A926GGC5_9RHOB|nr:alpha/beta fold hydrolase [Paracoccus amoyensis]MBC9248101.1 alpha/beta fold hydrolase [Paracoccus amoyensis]